MANGIAVTCCDGRIQKLILDYFQYTLKVSTVDMVTDWNVTHTLSEAQASQAANTVIKHVHFLIQHHDVELIAVIAHHECVETGESVDDALEALKRSVRCLRQSFFQRKIIGLWIDEFYDVHEISVGQDLST